MDRFGCRGHALLLFRAISPVVVRIFDEFRKQNIERFGYPSRKIKRRISLRLGWTSRAMFRCFSYLRSMRPRDQRPVAKGCAEEVHELESHSAKIFCHQFQGTSIDHSLSDLDMGMTRCSYKEHF